MREISRYSLPMSTKHITADNVRQALIQRIDAYKTVSGKSDSFVGKEAVKDDRFVSRIRAGGNFTVETYQRVMNWLDAQRVAA